MKLAKPSIIYRQTYLDALKEFSMEESEHYEKLNRYAIKSNFSSYVRKLENYNKGVGLPEGFVAATELWLIDDAEFIGHVSIRHQLTPYLKNYGGHIGYYIRPSKRRLGYGSQILKLALPAASSIGIKKALITCDDTNIGSIKIIEKNGGILENIIPQPKKPAKKRRYWINLEQ